MILQAAWSCGKMNIISFLCPDNTASLLCGAKWNIGLERIEKLKNDELITRPIAQEIYMPSAKDKIAQIPKEWEE